MISTKEMIYDLINREGGYVDHPADRGGPTNFGITLDTMLRWLVETMPTETAVQIYEKNYLMRPRINELPEILIPFMFDSAVHHGPKKAIEMLQWEIGVSPDGVIGPKTIAAAKKHASPALVNDLVARRLEYFHNIVLRDSSQSVFLKGWISRAESFQT